MSRPSASVPNQCGARGGASRFTTSVLVGSYGATSGATMASPMSVPIMIRPATDSGWRSAREATRRDRTRSALGASLVADLGIEEAIGKIDDQIGHGEDQGDQHGRPHDPREVLREDGATRPAPSSRRT